MSAHTSAVPTEASRDVDELCKRADMAEKAIAQLREHIDRNGATPSDLAVSKSKSSGRDATYSNAESSASLVNRLSTLRKLMLEDREECEEIRAQRDELREENSRLRQQVEKHEYRIKHLLRTINEIESQAGQK